MTATTITGIGELVTNDPDLGDAALGLVPRAALVTCAERAQRTAKR